MKKVLIIAILAIACIAAFFMRDNANLALQEAELYLKAEAAAKAVPENAALYINTYATARVKEYMEKKEVADMLESIKSDANIAEAFDAFAKKLSEATGGISESFIKSGEYSKAFDNYVELSKNSAFVGYVEKFDADNINDSTFAAVAYVKTASIKNFLEQTLQKHPHHLAKDELNTPGGLKLSVYAFGPLNIAVDDEKILAASSKEMLSKFADNIANQPQKSILNNAEYQKLTSEWGSPYLMLFGNFKLWESPKSMQTVQIKSMADSMLGTDKVKSFAFMYDFGDSDESCKMSLAFSCGNGFLLYDLINQSKLLKNNILETTPKNFVMSLNTGIAPAEGSAMKSVENLIGAVNPMLLMFKEHPVYVALKDNLRQINYVQMQVRPVNMAQIPNMLSIAYFNDAEKVEQVFSDSLSAFNVKEEGGATLYEPKTASIPFDIVKVANNQIGAIVKNLPIKTLADIMTGNKAETIYEDDSYNTIVKKLGNGNAIEMLMDYKKYTIDSMAQHEEAFAPMQGHFQEDYLKAMSEITKCTVSLYKNAIGESKIGVGVKAENNIISVNSYSVLNINYERLATEIRAWDWKKIAKAVENMNTDFNPAGMPFVADEYEYEDEDEIYPDGASGEELNVINEMDVEETEN